MKKIGIMGGTFNPIHNGHLLMAEFAHEQFLLDEVIFMPCNVNYLKDNTDSVPAEVRLEMTKLATEDNSHFSVSDIEIKRSGITYTSETIIEIKNENPDSEIYYICGADSLFRMESWHEPEIIFQNAAIICAVRERSSPYELLIKAEELRKKYNADIRILQMGTYDVSSTQIRQRIKDGLSVKYMTGDKVLNYIKENNLYK